MERQEKERGRAEQQTEQERHQADQAEEALQQPIRRMARLLRDLADLGVEAIAQELGTNGDEIRRALGEDE